MAQYIDKSALVAEIERRRDVALMRQRNLEAIGQVTVLDEMVANQLNRILSFINNLEVKEVDLEKELIEWHKEHFKKDRTFIGMSGFYLTNNSQMDIAKHFFELGLKAQKGEWV